MSMGEDARYDILCNEVSRELPKYKEVLVSNLKAGIWVTKKGEKFHIKDMTDLHLMNTIKSFRSKFVEFPHKNDYMKIMKTELLGRESFKVYLNQAS